MGNGHFSYYFDFLIILDFAAVINIDEPTSKWFWINSAIVVYFAIDYFRGLHAAEDKKLYFKTHIYDLLSIIPMGLLFISLNIFNLSGLVSDLRHLRLIRLAGLMGKLRNIFHTNGLLYVIFFTITFLLVGAEAFAITEHVTLDTAFGGSFQQLLLSVMMQFLAKQFHRIVL